MSLTVNAQQPYEWQWAMKGGGSLGGTGAGIDDERIYDIKVGTDNNYYFITSIAGASNANLDGYTVPVYNTSNTIAGGTKDIFLFSTDCEGNVRWSQAIGGWKNDTAYNLVLDDQNNVYVGANVRNEDPGSGGGIRPPLHFSDNDFVPFPDFSNGGVNIPQEGFKTTYLVKYDSNGNYIEKKALQGDVTGNNFTSQISDLAIDGDGKIHFIIGLINGTHLDGNVTVPSSFNTLYNYQYHLVTYDTYPNLDYNSSISLPISNSTGLSMKDTRFGYDSGTNTFYIAGERIGAPLMPLTYDGQTIVNRSYIIAINGNDGSKKWIREIYSDPGTSSDLTGNKISSVVIDDNSNVYIGGARFRHPTYLDLKIYDPTDSSVTPYNITTGADYTVPMIVKFNSDGDVQWVQATTSHDSTISASTLRRGKNIAINGNEIAFAAQGGADSWGAINIARPLGANFQPDPILVRLDKQTGNVIGVHDIEGEPLSTKTMTAVAVDNDGNYITGGSFNANLFINNTLGINPLISTGEADFFVAKLANSACGSVSTDDFNTLSFNVYPNPTTSIINVETTEQLSAYTIYDATERLVQERMFNGSNQINMENNSNGVYFIKIVTVEGNTGTVKVVKR
ncbi:T9SS type A sorting domain-containing protein [Flavobacterium sp. CBA20B-1]|uniref:T9SS type A sorting domain-containing protein n=1 Tax=unclassified Flavobacterium TaxID=196869 RepID=UPI002223F394|nr:MULTISPECIES: T9SS type A sorting domain-containing protein [unclassified Flavobacterium]WCM41945.1 T9SS type A sorting domain-containing protein [Flavobacterium sp. CBA20B-1]